MPLELDDGVEVALGVAFMQFEQHVNLISRLD